MNEFLMVKQHQCCNKWSNEQKVSQEVDVKFDYSTYFFPQYLTDILSQTKKLVLMMKMGDLALIS